MNSKSVSPLARQSIALTHLRGGSDGLRLFILDRTRDVALFALLVAFVILFGLPILGRLVDFGMPILALRLLPRFHLLSAWTHLRGGVCCVGWHRLGHPGAWMAI